MKKVDEWAGVPQEALQQDLRTMFRGAIRASLDVMLEAELGTIVGAEWYARVGGRRDRRNGTYVRQLLTSLGQIELTVPRARTAGTASAVVRRYQRRMEELVRVSARAESTSGAACVASGADVAAGELGARCRHSQVL